jgi:hypothetical protein
LKVTPILASSILRTLSEDGLQKIACPQHLRDSQLVE